MADMGHEHSHDHGEHDHDHDHGQEYEGDPGDADMRAALAQELLRMRPRDLLAQTAVMLANQAAIRMGLASPEHVDRDQAREAIDALGGVVELLAPLVPADELEGLRSDLAQLRMAFVQSAPPAAAPPPGAPPSGEPPAAAPASEPPADDGPGPERSAIWTPRGDA